MLLSILAKIIYIFILWRWILPLSKARKPIYVFLGITGLFILFLTAEIIFSWQYRQHTVEHMVYHPSPVFWLNLVIYLLVTLIIVTFFFTRESLLNERQKRQLIESQLSTELKFLKAQVNPHFLFNTLNNIFSIAQKNNDTETATSISKLAGLMRYMLYDSIVTKVSLKKELKNIHDYIALSKLRYKNDEVIVDVNEKGEVERMDIAPMILLPFVENAFKHGVDIEKITNISIQIGVEGSKIIFICKNPIREPDISDYREYGGIGLENVKRRLDLLYPGKHNLIITEADDLFTVHLELEA